MTKFSQKEDPTWKTSCSERDDHRGRGRDDGPPENHFELAPIVRAGNGEHVAQQGNKTKENRTVNDDDPGNLGDAVGQYGDDKR